MSIICTCGHAPGPMCNGTPGCPLSATDGMPAPKIKTWKERLAVEQAKQATEKQMTNKTQLPEEVPTAKQVMAKESMRPLALMDDDRLNLMPSEVIEAMLKFAKLHVQAALRAACEKAQISGEWDGQWNDDRLQARDADGHLIDVGADGNSIISAYPLTNIK